MCYGNMVCMVQVQLSGTYQLVDVDDSYAEYLLAMDIPSQVVSNILTM